MVNTDNVRFVHDTEIGCTIAFTLVNDNVIGTAAFTHKRGRGRNSKKPDQFCRAIGRSITLSRLEGTLSGRDYSSVPYSFIVKTKGDRELDPFDVHASIRTALETVKSIHPGYTYNTATYEEQLFNNTIIDAILNNVYQTVKNAG